MTEGAGQRTTDVDTATYVVDEVSATLKSRTGNGKTGVGTRTTDADQSFVVTPAAEESATLTKGSHSEAVSPSGRRKEDDENLVVEEPQTFDWQISGGGSDKSFKGKGRSWIEDKPGTARALTANKTLAVHVPPATVFQQTPQGDLLEDDEGASPPLLGREGSVGNNSPMVATGIDTQNQLETGDISPTLRTLRPGSSTGQDDAVPAVMVEEPTAFDWTGDDPGRTPPGETPPLTAGHAGEIAVGFLAGSSAATGGIGAEDEVAPTLGSVSNGSTRTPTVAYTKTHGAQDTEDAELWEEAADVRSLNSTAFATDVVVEDIVGALPGKTENGHGTAGVNDQAVAAGHVMAVSENQRRELRESDYAPALGEPSGHMGQGLPSVRAGAAVRRLTPRECERLQGFPDDWTRLELDTPDGPRYAGIGDAVTVSVPQWAVARLVRRET